MTNVETFRHPSYIFYIFYIHTHMYTRTINIFIGLSSCFSEGKKKEEGLGS